MCAKHWILLRETQGTAGCPTKEPTEGPLPKSRTNPWRAKTAMWSGPLFLGRRMGRTMTDLDRPWWSYCGTASGQPSGFFGGCTCCSKFLQVSSSFDALRNDSSPCWDAIRWLPTGRGCTTTACVARGLTDTNQIENWRILEDPKNTLNSTVGLDGPRCFWLFWMSLGCPLGGAPQDLTNISGILQDAHQPSHDIAQKQTKLKSCVYPQIW